MKGLILVMLGGASGAALRYALGRALPMAGGWPWATFLVNVAGGFAMGLLATWLLKAGAAGEALRLLLGVGFLGGFTTFSAFSLEMMQLIERSAFGSALAYSAASVVVALLAVFAGAAIGRMLWA